MYIIVIGDLQLVACEYRYSAAAALNWFRTNPEIKELDHLGLAPMTEKLWISQTRVMFTLQVENHDRPSHTPSRFRFESEHPTSDW